MRQNLRQEFNPSQINNLSQKFRLDLNSKPSDLSIEQWISLYRYKYNT